MSFERRNSVGVSSPTKDEKKEKRSEEDTLEFLSDRISDIEESVDLNKKHEGSVSKSLLKVHEDLLKLAETHKNVKDLWRQYKEIEKFVTPQGLDDLTLTNSSKQEIVFAGEEAIVDMGKKLEEISKLKEYINTVTLNELPVLCDRLAPVQGLHIAQEDQAAELSQRTNVLLATYNDVVAILSKKFIYWDNMLSEAEEKVAKLSAQ